MIVYIHQDLVACASFALCPDQEIVAEEPFGHVKDTEKRIVRSLHASYKAFDGTLVLDCTNNREVIIKQRQVNTVKRTIRGQRQRIHEVVAVARQVGCSRAVAEKRPHVGMFVVL